MNTYKLIGVLTGLAVGSLAHGAMSVSGSVGGAPTGVKKISFDDLPLGSAGGTAVGPNGSVSLSLSGGAAVVAGPDPSFYAQPVLSGGNGLGFGPLSTNQPDGQDGTAFVVTGLGTATLTFSDPQLYMGLLWGSVDSFNKLEFYNGATLVGTVTGSDVLASPNGDQGVDGTLYVNIISTIGFDRVVFTSTFLSFEFDDVAFNATVPGCSGCVLTQGYWKNHPDAWPVASLKLGNVSYTKAQAISILKQPVKGNGLVSLSYQLIAAKLNIAKGACAPANVVTAIAAADLLIGDLVVPPVGTGTAPTSLTSTLTDILDKYNNGLAPGGPAHCD